MLGKTEGNRRRGWQRMRWLDSITDSMDMNLSKLWETIKDKGRLACCSPWGCKESDTTWRLDDNKHSELKRRLWKVAGVPIMYISKHEEDAKLLQSSSVITVTQFFQCLHVNFFDSCNILLL